MASAPAPEPLASSTVTFNTGELVARLVRPGHDLDRMAARQRVLSIGTANVP